MPPIPTTKADLLRALETEQDWWRAVLDLAAQNNPVTGDEEVDGTWTLKELIAHIAGWRSWTLARLQAAANGSGTPRPPWPAGMNEDTEAGTDEINAWLEDQSHAETFEAVVTRLMDQIDALQAMIQQMNDDDLLLPGRFGWLDEAFASLPLGPALIGYSITHVHRDHAPALEAWLSARLGQHAELPPTPSNFGYED